ncbi:hypothetical protein [Streptococcus henryi]|uniref:hypothetical protein n=1 Tax=Streptococcus henryi TaxID=439219 RepID=UPI00037D4907|nr:hypothetical protein [Streptococcus henryi]
MKKAAQTSHQLLIQKLLVSIHYLTLFKDEIILVEKTPSLLGNSFSVIDIQRELGDILATIELLSKQEKLIRSTFWYDEASFKLMNHSLDIVGTWVRGIDNILQTCQSKSVFQEILGDDRPHIFGVLADVFSSLKLINLSLKEESEETFLLDPFKVNLQPKRLSKEQLLEKIDAMVPEGFKDEEEESEEEQKYEVAERSEVVKLFRHYLFDSGGGQVYVIDAKDELEKEIELYNSFNRFKGISDDISTSLVYIEEIVDEMEERLKKNATEETATEPPIYLVVYGLNLLMKDSRFEALMSELKTKNLFKKTSIFMYTYQAYD